MGAWSYHAGGSGSQPRAQSRAFCGAPWWPRQPSPPTSRYLSVG